MPINLQLDKAPGARSRSLGSRILLVVRLTRPQMLREAPESLSAAVLRIGGSQYVVCVFGTPDCSLGTS